MIAELSERLNEQLNDLVEELTERIPAQLGQEQSVAEHTEIVERQRVVQQRIQYLRRVAKGLAFVHPETVVPGRVGFGSVVGVEDLRSGDRMTYTIMSGEGLDLDAGEISLASPVGQALLGHSAGDVVEVETPQRTRKLRILSTDTLFDSLGSDQPEIEYV